MRVYAIEFHNIYDEPCTEPGIIFRLYNIKLYSFKCIYFQFTGERILICCSHFNSNGLFDWLNKNYGVIQREKNIFFFHFFLCTFLFLPYSIQISYRYKLSNIKKCTFKNTWSKPLLDFDTWATNQFSHVDFVIYIIETNVHL